MGSGKEENKTSHVRSRVCCENIGEDLGREGVRERGRVCVAGGQKVGKWVIRTKARSRARKQNKKKKINKLRMVCGWAEKQENG
jgi:hypothetical protein